MRAEEVCAIIVTRGDVDLEPVLEPLPYGEILIWDNSRQPYDQGAFGRYCAITQTERKVIYFQDDDCIIRCHDELLAAYTPGVIVANMPEGHAHGLYEEFDTCLLGWGSILDAYLPMYALGLWLDRYSADDDFRRIGADFVFPMLTPCHRIYHGHESLPYAWDANRTWRRPGYEGRRADYLMLAFEMRTQLGKERRAFA